MDETRQQQRPWMAAVDAAMEKVRQQQKKIEESPTRQLSPGAGDPAMAAVEDPVHPPVRKGALQAVPGEQPPVTAQRPPVTGYGDIWARIDEADAQYKKNLEELEGNRKRDERMSRIADGLSALHTIYEKARGAQPITGTGPSASASTRERYDKLRTALHKDYNEEIQGHLQRHLKRQAEQTAAENARWHDMVDAYRNKSLGVKEDIAADRDETARARNPLTAAQDAAYNAKYNEVYDDALASGLSEEQADAKAHAQAQRAGEKAYAAALLQQQEQKAQKAQDDHNKSESQVKKNNAQATKAQGGGKQGKGSTGRGSGEYTTTTHVKYVMDDYGNKIGEDRTTTKRKSPTAGTKTTKKKSPTKK